MLLCVTNIDDGHVRGTDRHTAPTMRADPVADGLQVAVDVHVRQHACALAYCSPPEERRKHRDTARTPIPRDERVANAPFVFRNFYISIFSLSVWLNAV